MSFDVLKKIEELKKSDMICAEGRYELVKAESQAQELLLYPMMIITKYFP